MFYVIALSHNIPDDLSPPRILLNRDLTHVWRGEIIHGESGTITPDKSTKSIVHYANSVDLSIKYPAMWGIPRNDAFLSIYRE